jgi:hypothetical protein
MLTGPPPKFHGTRDILPVPSGQAVIDIDPVGLHAEGGESVMLGGEVLGVGRATCVPDQHCGHVPDCTA